MTLFDYFAIGITLSFVIIGLFRGFIRELFSIISWFMSSILTVWLSPIINQLVLKKISNPFIANAIGSSVTFTAVIIITSIILSKIAANITSKIPKYVNLNLGSAFGFLKGFFTSSLIFIVILSVFGDTKDLATKSGPMWLQNSMTYRPLSFGGYLLLPLVQSVTGNLSQDKVVSDLITNIEKNRRGGVIVNKKHEEENNSNESTEDFKIDDMERTKEILKNVDLKNINIDDIGYKKEQIEKLQHLIDIVE
ncbi:MAG: CvpA family protein [Rickettsiales bacterium]|jgi:membrane protein required for colicin V production|nr:CvpA family protein [Rickettsiales bacterium]